MAASMSRRVLWKNLHLNRYSCRLCTSSSTRVPDHELLTYPGIPRGEIKVPKKIERHPTAILEALASTVNEDPTAAQHHYSLMDDPELYNPPSMVKNVQYMNVLLMSKVSGQRAARYFVNEYKKAFEGNEVPHIQAFMPQSTGYQNTEVCEEALQERISRREALNSVRMFETLQNQEMSVGEDTRLALLELLCVFGSEYKPEEYEYMNEELYWLPRTANREDNQAKNERTMTVAQEIFDGITEKTADVYNCIVRGAFQMNQTEVGNKYIKEMNENNIPVYVGTYNALLKNIVKSFDGGENFKTAKKDTNAVLETVKKMSAEGVAANIETFHALLGAQGGDNIRLYSDVMAEMDRLGLEPNLETWTIVASRLMQLKDKNRIAAELREIIENIRSQSGSISRGNINRECFFNEAMKTCLRHSLPKEGLMLHELRKEFYNKYVITDLDKESSYCIFLLKLVAQTESCELMMQLYDELYPKYMRYVVSLVDLLVSVVDMYEEYEHIPRLWQDYVDRNPDDTDNMFEKMLSIMTMKSHSESLKMQFFELAKAYFKDWEKSLISDPKDKFKRRPKAMKTVKMNDGLLVCIMQISLNVGKISLAESTFELFSRSQIAKGGNVLSRDERTIEELLHALIDVRNTRHIKKYVRVCLSMRVGSVCDILQDRMSELEEFMTYEDIEEMTELVKSFKEETNES